MWYVHEHEHDYSKSASVLTVNRPGAPIWECEKTIKLYNSQLKIDYCYCIMQQFFELFSVIALYDFIKKNMKKSFKFSCEIFINFTFLRHQLIFFLSANISILKIFLINFFKA